MNNLNINRKNNENISTKKKKNNTSILSPSFFYDFYSQFMIVFYMNTIKLKRFAHVHGIINLYHLLKWRSF